MIKSFKCSETEKIWNQKFSGRFSRDLQIRARRRLLMLDAACSLSDLRLPPANRLEKLKGGRSDQYSVRINSQWRICFSFKNGEVFDIEIVDYH